MGHYRKIRALAVILALLAAAALSSCGAEADPWDYSLKPEAELIDTDAGLIFSKLEWTGKPFSRDLQGNSVSQSDIVRVNTIGYHSVGTAVYDSVEKALEGARGYDRSLSDYYELLTGEENVWQLAVYKNVDDATAAGVYDEFYRTDYDMSAAPEYEGEQKIYSSSNAYYGGFKDVTLPASWQTQGFDFPIYTNTIYPWNDGAYGTDKTYAPNIPTVMNPVGFYRHYFDVDPEWISEGRRVYISFGGVESAYYVYVNGHEVGYSEDTFDAADFDITPYLNPDGKDNLLAVEVHRWCDGSYFENQDFLRLAGIFRDVYLYSTTGVRISDYRVITDLDKSYKDADLKLEVEISNTTVSDTAEGLTVDVKLFDADKNEVFASSPMRKAVPKTASGETASVSLSKKVSSPRLWSDEDPYLYTLVVSLYDGSGAYYGSISQQLGFRELSFTPTEGTTENELYSQVLLNGKPLILKGVDRHEVNPETGRYLPMELEEKDVKIMKSLNINAVRTSHYPDDENFYNMCDKYGILVMGECNVETHYNVSAGDTETYFSKVIRDRIEAHTEAYKNRTCIIIWSMGNETVGGGDTFVNCIAELKQRDPTRPIHFESQGSGGGVDIASTMYSPVSDVEWRGTWENRMPYILCEYAHAMGNSVGNLYEYWEAIRKYDNVLGGFIWDFVDQAIWTEIPNANGYDHYGNGKFLAYGGTWGDNPNSGDFCQNGIISADREIQPEAQEVKYVYQSVWFDDDRLTDTKRTIEIYNEFRFTDLSAFDFGYELLRNGVVVDSGSFEVECAPLETVEVEIPYTLENKPDSEYLLNVYAALKEDNGWGEKGSKIAIEQFDIRFKTDESEADTASMPELEVSDADGSLTVTANDGKTVIVFDKAKGDVSSFTVNGEDIFEKGPVPNYKRARLSNDNIGTPLDNASVSSAESFEYELSGDKKTLTVTERLKLSANGSYDNMTYTVYGNGAVNVSCNSEFGSDVTEVYKYGNLITLPADYENMTYYGSGEADTYCDRRRGSPLGVYSQTVTDSFYPYGKPQDTGNKTGVRWLALTSDEKNTGILIAATGELEASALHYSVSDLSNARYPYQLPTDIKHTYLNVDYGSRGTGGASCGPEPLSQYKVVSTSLGLRYSYTIVPFDKNADDPQALAELWTTEK